jgi:hypothetical protein
MATHDGPDPWRYQRASYDVSDWQRILNEHDVPPRRVQRDGWVRVTARIVWERDGVEYLETVCVGWTSRLARVELAPHERRRRILVAWLAADDVRRGRVPPW